MPSRQQWELCPDRALFEGQAAMELEAEAQKWLLDGRSGDTPYPFGIQMVR